MKKKLLSLIMAATLVLAMPLTAFAQDFNDGADGSITVTANVTSTYTVRLPATIELTRDAETGKYKADYTVGVRGQLAATNRVEVTPTPSVEMTDGSHTVNAAVTQTVIAWEHDQSRVNENPTTHVLISPTEFIETTGHIETVFEHLGSYTGTLTFNIEEI